METEDLIQIIETAWDERDNLSQNTSGSIRDAIEMSLAGMDSGKFLVAEKKDDSWVVNEWLKKSSASVI